MTSMLLPAQRLGRCHLQPEAISIVCMFTSGAALLSPLPTLPSARLPCSTTSCRCGAAGRTRRRSCSISRTACTCARSAHPPARCPPWGSRPPSTPPSPPAAAPAAPTPTATAWWMPRRTASLASPSAWPGRGPQSIIYMQIPKLQTPVGFHPPLQGRHRELLSARGAVQRGMGMQCVQTCLSSLSCTVRCMVTVGRRLSSHTAKWPAAPGTLVTTAIPRRCTAMARLNEGS